jgi:predicted lactoylglutathione lyase
MVISDDIYTMLLTHAKFAQFIKQPLSDAHRQTEMLLALSFDSRAEVDALVDKALAGGAKPAGETQDLGFMYSRSFHDLDGHIWEPFWMDPAAIK